MYMLSLIFMNCIYMTAASTMIASEYRIKTGYNLNNTFTIANVKNTKNMNHCSAWCQTTQNCLAIVYTESTGLCELQSTTSSEIIISKDSNEDRYIGILEGIEVIDYNDVAIFEKTTTAEITSSMTTAYQTKNWTALGADDCYHTTSLDYGGTVSTTINGRTCQYWNTNAPHTVYYQPVDVTAQDTNYCRESTHNEGAPGCYTTDPNVNLEYCFIVKCDACGVDENLPVAPSGTTSSIQFGKFIGMQFTCNNRVPGTSTEHCPVSQCGSDDQWSNYLVSCTDEDCYTSSSLYNGKVTCTNAGIPCMQWNQTGKSTMPSNSDKYTNYCRDPDGTGKPWCYTADSNVIWDFCPVPLC